MVLKNPTFWILIDNIIFEIKTTCLLTNQKKEIEDGQISAKTEKIPTWGSLLNLDF